MSEADHEADLEAIARVRLGDREAYGDLVRRYEQRIRKYCYNMLGDSQLAEDSAQEVFLKAFRSLDRFRADATFYTWLYRIATNCCLDILRKQKRAPSESFDQLLEHDVGQIERVLNVGEPLATATEQRDLVAKALALVRPEYREVLVLREIEELSYQEMAETLECTVDVVKGRLKRARKQIYDKTGHLVKPTSTTAKEVTGGTPK